MKKRGTILPDFDAWAEVKPGRLSKEEVAKVKALYRLTGKPVMLLCGVPDTMKGYPIVLPAKDGGFDIEEWLHFDKKSVEAARSARFEHGESG